MATETNNYFSFEKIYNSIRNIEPSDVISKCKNLAKGIFPGLQNASQTLETYNSIKPTILRVPYGFYFSTIIAFALFVSNVLTWFGVYNPPEAAFVHEEKESDYSKKRQETLSELKTKSQIYHMWDWVGFINALVVNSTGMAVGVLQAFQAFGIYALAPTLIVATLAAISGYFAAYEMTKEFSLAGLGDMLTDYELNNDSTLSNELQEANKAHNTTRNEKSFLNEQLTKVGLQHIMSDKTAYACALLVSLIFAFFQYQVAHLFVAMSIRFIPFMLKVKTIETAASVFGWFSAAVTFLILLPANYAFVMKEIDAQGPEETPKETKSEQSQDNIFQFSDAAKASFYITLISTVANLSVAIFSQFANYFSFGVSFSATALMVTPCIPVFSGFIDNGRVWQEEKLNEIKPYVDQLLSLKA